MLVMQKKKNGHLEPRLGQKTKVRMLLGQWACREQHIIAPCGILDCACTLQTAALMAGRLAYSVSGPIPAAEGVAWLAQRRSIGDGPCGCSPEGTAGRRTPTALGALRPRRSIGVLLQPAGQQQRALGSAPG